METLTINSYLNKHRRSGQYVADLLGVTRQRITQMKSQKKTFLVKCREDGTILRIWSPEEVIYEP